MTENTFITDLWDVLRGNTEEITIDEFRSKYDELLIDAGSEEATIRLGDDRHEWWLSLRKIY